MFNPRSTAEKLSKQFVEAFGSELRSVLLFGSAARGEAVPGISDVNVLLILEQVDARRVATAAPIVQDWVRRGNTPPHLFSSEEWAGMGDTFAIEISDMQDAREVIHGVDPVPLTALKNADIRLHAEHEIRETILHLRLRMLLAAEHPRELGNLIVSGLPSFSAYMRAALRLCGQDAPLETPTVIERASALIETDPQPMLRCYEARCSQEPLGVPITDPLVGAYTEYARRLSRFIDQIPN